MINLVGSGPSHIAGYSHVRCVGVDAMHDHFSRLVRSHEADVVDSRDDFVAELQHAPLSRMVLSSASVEGGVTVRARPKHTYLVFGAEGAALYMRIGERDTVVPEGMIGVIPPGVPYRLYLPRGGCRTLMLEMEPDFLESILAEEIRSDLTRPLSFEDDAGSHGAGERHFVELLKHVRDQLAQGAPQFRNSGYVTKLEQLLASALVHSTPHNYSGRLDAINDPAEPRFVRRAVDFIHAHAGEPITLPSIAQSAAVSLRKLFRGFHTYRNCTPAAYLRSVRLERCHQDLLSAMPGEISVTTVASRWGFSNAGRFARCYREQFGENPADTLRRKARP